MFSLDANSRWPGTGRAAKTKENPDLWRKFKELRARLEGLRRRFLALFPPGLLHSAGCANLVFYAVERAERECVRAFNGIDFRASGLVSMWIGLA